ncbi:hypothetical protein NP493_606g00005 [Ridgeia piscesae]|uniref:Uncharacterized protein n=1 Tax=Ridgeia piscesae TaxID=27915 RepID=A0AAD9NQX4_RIDPI|nr:hypothetical protein NP493_606g00005 [Ridgeia piscesae]
MRRQIDLQVDHDYEKLQRSCSTSSQSPGSCGGFYNSLVEVDAKQTPDVTTASGGLKHSVTTDLERFADCSDESGGHM